MDMPRGHVELRRDNGVLIVSFRDHKILEESIVQALLDEVTAIIEGNDAPRIVYDFGVVDHFSSAMLGALISCSQRAERKGGVSVLAAIKPALRDVFKITKLDRYWRIFPTVADAVRELGDKQSGQ